MTKAAVCCALWAPNLPADVAGQAYSPLTFRVIQPDLMAMAEAGIGFGNRPR